MNLLSAPLRVAVPPLSPCPTTGSKICLVEPVVELDLEVHSIKAADWLATWLRRRARCLKSLRLAQLQDFLKESEDGASVTARLQQEREAMGGVLAALLETAKAAAAGGGTAAAAGAEAAAGGGEAAAGAAARRPLGLETLILRGSLACYPELSSLLAALPELRDVQLCADLNVAVDYSSVNALSAAPLGKQLTVLGGLSNLQALRVDDYLEDLGGGSWRDVLPATLTALTLVVDDAMVNGGHLSHLVNLRQLYLTDPGEHLGTGKLLQEPLTAVKGLRALPALQEVMDEVMIESAMIVAICPADGFVRSQHVRCQACHAKFMLAEQLSKAGAFCLAVVAQCCATAAVHRLARCAPASHCTVMPTIHDC